MAVHLSTNKTWREKEKQARNRKLAEMRWALKDLNFFQ